MLLKLLWRSTRRVLAPANVHNSMLPYSVNTYVIYMSMDLLEYMIEVNRKLVEYHLSELYLLKKKKHISKSSLTK